MPIFYRVWDGGVRVWDGGVRTGPFLTLVFPVSPFERRRRKRGKRLKKPPQSWRSHTLSLTHHK